MIGLNKKNSYFSISDIHQKIMSFSCIQPYDISYGTHNASFPHLLKNTKSLWGQPWYPSHKYLPLWVNNPTLWVDCYYGFYVLVRKFHMVPFSLLIKYIGGVLGFSYQTNDDVNSLGWRYFLMQDHTGDIECTNILFPKWPLPLFWRSILSQQKKWMLG